MLSKSSEMEPCLPAIRDTWPKKEGRRSQQGRPGGPLRRSQEKPRPTEFSKALFCQTCIPWRTSVDKTGPS